MLICPIQPFYIRLPTCLLAIHLSRDSVVVEWKDLGVYFLKRVPRCEDERLLFSHSFLFSLFYPFCDDTQVDWMWTKVALSVSLCAPKSLSVMCPSELRHNQSVPHNLTTAYFEAVTLVAN